MGKRRTTDFRGLMERAGLNPVTLSAATGVSVTTIYRTISGTVPGSVILQALSRGLLVSVEECRHSIERSAQRGAA